MRLSQQCALPRAAKPGGVNAGCSHAQGRRRGAHDEHRRSTPALTGQHACLAEVQSAAFREGRASTAVGSRDGQGPRQAAATEHVSMVETPGRGTVQVDRSLGQAPLDRSNALACSPRSLGTVSPLLATRHLPKGKHLFPVHFLPPLGRALVGLQRHDRATLLRHAWSAAAHRAGSWRAAEESSSVPAFASRSGGGATASCASFGATTCEEKE